MLGTSHIYEQNLGSPLEPLNSHLFLGSIKVSQVAQKKKKIKVSHK